MNFKKIPYLSLIIGFLFTQNHSAQEQTNQIEDEITYNATIKNDVVHVLLSTTDKPTMLSMLHRGFYVYFDVKGKKKKKVSIQYPLETERPERKQGQNREEGQNRGEDQNREERDENERGPNILEILNKLPKKAQYTNLDLSQEFNIDINSIGVNLAYTYDETNGRLDYQLEMPVRNITDKNIDISKLSIGIVSVKNEENERPQSNMSIGGGRPSGGGMGGGGGGMGGGMRGGGMGGGGRQQGGNANGGGGGGQQNQRPQSVDINFWFKIPTIE